MKEKTKQHNWLYNLFLRRFVAKRKTKLNDLQEELKKKESNVGLEDCEPLTEDQLFDFLLLNPLGYVDDETKEIIQSDIAEKYYRMGYLTKGVSQNMKPQYRLTAFGLKQIKNAQALTILG